MKRGVHWMIGTAAVLFLLFAGPDALAKKPGGGSGGGGGDEGMADADVVILYRDLVANEGSSEPAAMWKGDAQGNVERVTATPGCWPSFGPAGTNAMVFAAETDGPGLYVASDLSASDATLLVGTAKIAWATPSWSNGTAPNGEEMIAYIDVEAETGLQQLYVTTLDGEATQLTLAAGAAPETYTATGASGTYVYPVTYDPAVPPPFAWQAKFHPVWNPATNDQIVMRGQYVAREVNETGEVVAARYVRSLWLLTVDGDPTTGDLWISEAESITHATPLEHCMALSPSFSADGGEIVFQAQATPSTTARDEVWSYDVADGTFDDLTSGIEGHKLFPSLLPDGRVICSVLQARVGMTLRVMDPATLEDAIYGNAKGRSQHEQFHVAVRR